MPFIEKHPKHRVNGVHVLDTDEGPVDMASEIHAMTTTSMFLGRSMGEIARTLAKKAYHHDRHFVATMAHPGAHAKTIFEFLEELSGTSTKNPPLASGLRLLLGYKVADQDSVLESVVAFLYRLEEVCPPRADTPPHPTVAPGISVLMFEHEAFFKASFAVKFLDGTSGKVPIDLWLQTGPRNPDMAAKMRSEWTLKAGSTPFVRPKVGVQRGPDQRLNNHVARCRSGPNTTSLGTRHSSWRSGSTAAAKGKDTARWSREPHPPTRNPTPTRPKSAASSPTQTRGGSSTPTPSTRRRRTARRGPSLNRAWPWTHLIPPSTWLNWIRWCHAYEKTRNSLSMGNKR
jgi:hypothetical protein